MSTTKTKVLICPYCGDTQPAGERCRVCGGLFEPLSRQASHNAMGPWFVRDERRPFQPGASYETIVKLIERGQITRYSILRCPTTKQFWTVARRVPGIAHLLGYCHNCDATVSKDDHGCPSCGVPFGAYLDRNYLGLPEVKPLPWEAPLVDDGRPRGAAAGHSPMVDFRRAAEPLGLSSFASDDELRGMAARPAPTYQPASAAMVTPGGNHDHAGSVASPTAATASHAQPLDSVSSLAARSLQRRLHSQQQTIRLLMMAMGLVSIVSVIVIIAMFLRLGRGDAHDTSQSQTSNSDVAEKAGDSGKSTAAKDASVLTQPLEGDDAAATMPSDDLATPPAEVADSVTADHERAMALMAEARKEGRPLKDRIIDAESAAALLKSIKQNAAATDMPAALDDEIAEADRLVERLKLQEYFP